MYERRVVIGFSGYLGGFEVDYKVFYWFLEWIDECGATTR